jgi:hypothetical protein
MRAWDVPLEGSRRRAVVAGLVAIGVMGTMLIEAPGASAATFRACDSPPPLDIGFGGPIATTRVHVRNLRATRRVRCAKARRVSRNIQRLYDLGPRCLREGGVCTVSRYYRCRNPRDGGRQAWFCRKDRKHRIRFRIELEDLPTPPDVGQ